MYFYRFFLPGFLKNLISYFQGEGDGGGDNSGDDNSGGDNSGDDSDTGNNTITVEQYKKLQDELKNYKGAIKSEREKRREEKEALQKYRDEEKKNLENEQKKKGKYIELIENKDKEIGELNNSILNLKEKASAWDSFQEKQKANLEEEYTELTSKIDKNILEKNNFILEDLNLEKKVLFLKNLQEIVKPNDFGSKPDNKGKVNPGDITDDLKLKSFEEKVSKGEKITPRERGEYLTLLRGIKK